MRCLWLAASLCVLLAVVGPGVVSAKKKADAAPPPPAPEAKSGSDSAKIEEVTAKQLEKFLLDKDYVAVFWYARSCHTCDKVLAELEKIDDDTDKFGVDFIKINDKRLAKKYGIKNFPALTYFREKEPIIYEGDLMDEDAVLDFLTSLESMDLPDRIEEVNSKILDKIVEDNNYVAVLFWKSCFYMGLNDDKTSNPFSPKELQPFKCCPYKDSGKKGKKEKGKASKGGKEKKPSHYVATWW